MATCTISGNLLEIDGTAATSVTVFARIPRAVVSGSSVLTPFQTSAVTDASGNFVLTLQTSISVIFTLQYPIVGTESTRALHYTGNIPATATASFSDVIVIE